MPKSKIITSFNQITLKQRDIEDISKGLSMVLGHDSMEMTGQEMERLRQLRQFFDHIANGRISVTLQWSQNTPQTLLAAQEDSLNV